MKTYITRALKYIVRMLVIIGLVITILCLGGYMRADFYDQLFVVWKDFALAGVLVVFAMMYPNISFGTFRVPGDINANRAQIVDAFAAYSYSLVKEEDGKMIFRSRKMLKRILWQFDDAVTVWQNGDNIEIEGLKKIISRVQLRLDAYINHGQDEK